MFCLKIKKLKTFFTLSNKHQLSFQEYLKFGALLPYLGVVILLILYVYFVIPETRDMKGPEIDKFFQRRSRGCCSKNVEMDPEVEADSNQEKILN